MSKFKIIALLPLLPFLSACHKPATAEAPVKVKVFQLDGGNAQAGLYYSGTLEAGKNVSLSFLTMGTVSEVAVREGDSVKKGQTLARLDCRSNRDAFAIAQEKAKQAQDAFNRFEPMYQHGNLPEIKMVEIRTAKRQAELAAEMAEKNVEDCALRAPSDGLISDRALEPGDNVIPGRTALKLADVRKLYAVIAVPEQEIRGIKKGMPAEAELSGQEGLRLKGAVSDVGVSAEPLSRTYTARILIGNPDRAALPGMLCNIYIARPGRQPQIAIPATAVTIDGEGRQFVYVVDTVSKRVRKNFITSSGFRESAVLVSSGLRGSELIVRSGAQKLDDNMPVDPEL